MFLVNKRTGALVPDGIGGESGEQVVATRANSALVISEGAELDGEWNVTGYFAFFYRLQDDRLVKLAQVPIPREFGPVEPE